MMAQIADLVARFQAAPSAFAIAGCAGGLPIAPEDGCREIPSALIGRFLPGSLRSDAHSVVDESQGVTWNADRRIGRFQQIGTRIIHGGQRQDDQTTSTGTTVELPNLHLILGPAVADMRIRDLAVAATHCGTRGGHS